MLYFIQGNDNPAECNKLEDQTVAVVCISENGSYGPDNSAQKIARAVGKILAVEVDGIKVIHHSKVNNWLDTNEEGSTNFRKIGKDLEADMVLAIELSGYSLHEGQTMYKGRAGIDLTLYDLADTGDIVWEANDPEYSYPYNSGIHISELSEASFEKKFILEISKIIARRFHPHERVHDVARDVSALHTD